MLAMRKILSFTLLVFLTACVSVDQEGFARYARQQVKVGMSLQNAKQVLADDGFHCDARSMQPYTTCTRNKQSLLPSTCVERINLLPDSDASLVLEMRVAPIVCAGL